MCYKIYYDFYKENNIIEDEIWIWDKYYVKGKLKENFTNYYIISNYGRCKSVDRIINRTDYRKLFYCSKYKKPYWNQPKKYRRRGNMHLKFQLSRDGKTYPCSIHKLVKESFDGPTPKNKQISHKDENPHNNYLLNLQWLTPKEHRIYDKIYGEGHGYFKLTDKQVLEIRKLYQSGYITQIKLANRFNISFQHISDIVNYKKRKIINRN